MRTACLVLVQIDSLKCYNIEISRHSFATANLLSGETEMEGEEDFEEEY